MFIGPLHSRRVVQTRWKGPPRQQAARCFTSYRKNHDRKKPFYVFVKFIFPNDDGGLTMPSNAARWRQQADKLGIFAQTPKKIALAKMMIALLGASVNLPMINFDHCAGRCSAIAQPVPLYLLSALLTLSANRETNVHSIRTNEPPVQAVFLCPKFAADFAGEFGVRCVAAPIIGSSLPGLHEHHDRERLYLRWCGLSLLYQRL